MTDKTSNREVLKIKAVFECTPVENSTGFEIALTIDMV